MKNVNLRKASLLVIVTGILIIAVFSLMMTMAAPAQPHQMPNKAGFSNSLIWFEMVLEAEEVFNVLGPSDSESGQQRRNALDIQNKIDFAFMIVYSLYHLPVFFFLMLLHRSRGDNFFSSNKYFYLGLATIPVMLIGDFIETRQLLVLTKALTVSDISETVLSSLIIWTRIKWAALFVALLMIALSYTVYYGLGLKLVLPFLFTMGALSGFLSLIVVDLRAMLELASVLLSIAWLSVLIHAIIVHRAN